MKKLIVSVVVTMIPFVAQAGIINANNPGQMLGSAAGLDLTSGSTQMEGVVQGYDERSVTTTEDVKVDFLVNENLFLGNAFTGIDEANSYKTLVAGDYDSHLLRFDTPDINVEGDLSNAIFEFDGDIVAIILSNGGSAGALLNLSDAIFGNAASYDTGLGRRAESNDHFTLDLANSRTLTVDRLRVSNGFTDEIRVITRTQVAEPSMLGLMGLSLAGLFFARRRKEAKSEV